MTETDRDALHVPPQGAAPVYRRLLRSYGPLAVIALLLMLMAAFVPTMDEEVPVTTTNPAAESSHAEVDR